MKILVTGCAGFIGMHVCERLLARGDEVIGIDNLNDYYDVSLKEARLARLLKQSPSAQPLTMREPAGLSPSPLAGEGRGEGVFKFHKLNIADRSEMAAFFEREKPQCVVHLAAQAGVRYSLKNPHAYVDSNVVGFVNVLEGCRHSKVEHFVYASSSSVYGGNTKLPFSEYDNVDHPVSLYAATKKANELMAHTYSHLYGLPTTGLRFFTVYGPWGRPDMSPILFAKAIDAGKPIDVFNRGKMQRDFTYIDDVVEGVVRVLNKAPVADAGFDKTHPDPATSWAPYRIFNIGNHQPVELMTFIATLESALGKTAQKNFLPMQDGDVTATHADTQALRDLTGFAPSTSLSDGVGKFVTWFRHYYSQEASKVHS